MTRVLISAAADADVAAIVDDLNIRAGRLVVTKYVVLLRDLYRRLGAHPESGPPRKQLWADIRIAVVRPYIVIYRYAQVVGTVTILRVVHGRRKISGRMLRVDAPSTLP